MWQIRKWDNLISGVKLGGQTIRKAFKWDAQIWPVYVPPVVWNIISCDFTNETNQSLINQWFESVWEPYWLTVSWDWSWLNWVTYETDTASGIEFPYSASLVWKQISWTAYVHKQDFDLWWGPKLTLHMNPTQTGRYKYSNISYIPLAWTVWEYDSGWPTYSNVDAWFISIYGWNRYDWNKSGSGLYRWSLYAPSWSENLWFGADVWTYKMEWFIDFDTWAYQNTRTNPNWDTYTFERYFTPSDTSQEAKAIINNSLASSNKRFAIEISRWRWYEWRDVDRRLALYVDVY